MSGNGQFGVAFDDYGNRFLCNNRHPLEHVVLEDRYLKRNTLLAVPAVMWDVAAADNDAHIYPLSMQWATSHLHTGQFTAACGTDIYRGDSLPRTRAAIRSRASRPATWCIAKSSRRWVPRSRRSPAERAARVLRHARYLVPAGGY